MNLSANRSKVVCPSVPSAGRTVIRKIQLLTVGWMCVELSVAIIAGVRAHSVALTAFGGDSAVELLSALVVLRRLRLGPAAEKAAARTNAILLYTLAAYIVCTSALSLFIDRFQAKPSLPGIALLIAAALVMPFLGALKKHFAVEMKSAALKADAAQSNLCAYMSWIALAGLGINAVFHLPWADSVAALCLLPLVFHEASEARKGEVCHC